MMTPAARERMQVQAPLLIITSAAWITLIVKSGSLALAGSCCQPATLTAAFSSVSLHQLITLNPPSSLALGWALMLVAMMAPLLAGPVRYVIDRSFYRRRARATLLFVAGYVAIWMAAGALIITLALMVRLVAMKSLFPMASAMGIILLWECSPVKQRCLNRGHAHSALAAYGASADLDVLRFGIGHGFWCIGSCWALMLLPELISTGHLAAMAVVTPWLCGEHLNRPMKPSWSLRGPRKAVRLTIAQMRMVLDR